MALSNLRHDPQWHSYGPWSVCLKGSEVPTDQWWGPCVENGLVTRRTAGVFKWMEWGKARLWGLLSWIPSPLRSLCSSCWVWGKKMILMLIFMYWFFMVVRIAFSSAQWNSQWKEMKVFLWLSWVRFPKTGGNRNDLWGWLERYSVI